MRRLVEKYRMRILTGHDSKVIVADPTSEKGFVLHDVGSIYD